MKLSVLTQFLESYAPLNYQEDYDNSGLIIGNGNDEIHAALVSLDCTEKIIDEAISKGCNLVISHHPIVFKGLKRFNGSNYVSRVVEKAIKHNIAVYAIHTNLDHVANGVNGMISRRLGLERTKILSSKGGHLKKLVTFCPVDHADAVRTSMFNAGAGHIGNYSACSFNTAGTGTFKAGAGADPFVGEIGKLHKEDEIRIETIYRQQDERKILIALLESHPYEEVAYDIYPLGNTDSETGAGMVGFLPHEMSPLEFFRFVKERMHCQVIRHTALLSRNIRKVAVCGGSGSFLLKDAIAAGADAFVTADFKYHEFFDAEEKLIIADIGHFETEQFTSDLLMEIINEKFSNFAIRKTEHNTNPINYFF